MLLYASNATSTIYGFERKNILVNFLREINKNADVILQIGVWTLDKNKVDPLT